jgi:uncharacterized protein DUF3943
MAVFYVRALLVVLGCAMSACASRAHAQVVVPRSDQVAVSQAQAPVAEPRQQDEHTESPDDQGHKSYVLPVIEILAMDAAFNLAGRVLYEPATFEVTSKTIRRNLRGPWVVDDDPFQVNQFGHPYQGAMYHGIARSNGLNYWTSMAYTFASSALWEIAGETTPPSRNDQIASGIAGSFLGEPLFRISRLLLDHGPGPWRKFASVLVSPPTGLNHLMVGNPAGTRRLDAVPFSDIRAQFGVTAITADDSRTVSSLALDQPRVALSMDYGYPGSAGYRHERPFDYFRIESSISGEGLEHLSTRGVIAGADYGSGRLAGLWGLYGTYDYFAPHDFRFSSTSFSFGTTLQAPLSGSLVVQSSGLIGAGYVAAFSEERLTEPNDHYGVAPQGLANLRFIAGRRAALDVTARQYYISTLGGFGTGQRDLIFVGDAWLALRVVGRHGLGVTYQLAGRSSDYLELPNQTQARATVGVYYTFLGSGGFGAAR